MLRQVHFPLLCAGAAFALSACSGPAAKAPAQPVAKAPAKATTARTSPAATGAAAAEIPQLVQLAQTGPTKAQYPQADALVAVDQDDITLEKDGSMVEHHKSIVRILDAQRGKQKFADVHIPYDSKRQTLTIQIARTVNDDGGVHAASGSEISDILPPELEGATMYSSVLERVVSFPAVDKGSVVELEYTRTTKPGPDAAMGGQAALGMWDPIAYRTVTVTVPTGTTPVLDVEGMTLQPTESADAASGTHTYTFTERNVPDRQPESGSPPDSAILPRLLYSFLPDWREVEARVSDRYLGVALPQTVPAAVKKEADSLVAAAAAKTPAASALAIYKFVAHDVRSVDLPLGWAGYAPNPPDVVLANRYGDDRDKVGLLLALCKAEGISGEPVLVRTQGVPVVQKVPTIAQFNRMIAELTINGQNVWVDPSDEDGQFGAAFAGQGNLALALQPGGGELAMRPLLDPGASTSHIVAVYSLTNRGDLDARYQYDVSGWFADQASGELRALKGDNLKQFFQEAAAGLSASAIDAGHHVGDLMSVKGPIEITHHVSVADYAPAQGKFRVFELPGASLGFAEEVPSAGLTTRKYPLWLGTPRTLDANVSVSLPAGWKVAYAPPALKGSTDGVAYDESCNVKGRAVTCHSKVTFDKLEVTPAQYDGFHRALTKLDDYSQRVLLLTK